MRSLMHQGLRGIWLAAFMLLAGCAALPEASPEVDAASVDAIWTARQQQLAAVKGFELGGRVAVKGGGLSGALHWQQDGEHFRLRIAGPFGAGALSMEGTAALVSIKGKDIDLVTTDPQQVLAERTGWRLPLAALRWWVLGLPDPHSPADITLDAEGRAISLRQTDWLLQYSDYRSGTTPTLPGRIEASQQTAAGEWKATVVVETLRLSP